MKKEGLELPDYVIEAIEEVLAEDPDFDIEQLDEAEDLDADSSSKALMHDCAKHVVHKEHGEDNVFLECTLWKKVRTDKVS